MNIFSTITIDGKIFYLTDEQARYMLKESVYHGEISKFVKYYDPYTDINGNAYDRFEKIEDSYIPSNTGEYLYNSDTHEYYNPLDTPYRFSRNCMYVKDQAGEFIYDSTSGAFVNPYTGVARYRSEGEFTWNTDDDGEYVYDPLCDNQTHGFYKPYYDKYDATVALTRYKKVPNGTATPDYIEFDNGEYVYDSENDLYYNPLYDKNDQTIALTKYSIGSNIQYIEDPEGQLIYNSNQDIYYNPYTDVQTYSPSNELSTFSADPNGNFIPTEPFDKDSRPNFGFFNEFPEYRMDSEEFVLGQMDIFETTAEQREDLITEINIDVANLEIGSIDRINGQPLKDEVKCRCDDYLVISPNQKYSVTNDNMYWMQIFEYKFDTVINDYVFIRSYKLTYGTLMTTSSLTTHVKVASGEADTTDLFNVKLKLVTDPNADSYVFNGPKYETYDEAYKAGFFYFFDTTDRSQFCKLVGDGTNCQAYERYQISTKILKQVSEINDATNQALSRITQTGAEITLEVQSTARDLRSYIQQQMNVIRLEVIDGDNQLHTQIQMTADAITSLATSAYLIIDHRSLPTSEVQYSINNPELFSFADKYPDLVETNFTLDPDRIIHTDYISAYDSGYNYFGCGVTYIESNDGMYVLNGTYYDPYELEISAGRHRYTKVPGTASGTYSDNYIIDDTNGIYIKFGESYINPYDEYPRYTKLNTFNRLTYNVIEGYGYDIYTNTQFSLKSLIEQTASKIRLEVSDTSGDIISRINISQDQIVLSVENLRNETNTKITQTADNISAVASSGGTIILNTAAAYGSGVTDFYSARPLLVENSYAFNDSYKQSFQTFQSAYDAGYPYFEYTDMYKECDHGKYIKNDDNEYVDPYDGKTRYLYIENMAASEDSISYIANANGRYIRNESNEYVDPYEGKVRYSKEPTYCATVKNGDVYTVNLLMSSTHYSQSRLDFASDQVKITVTDNSGAMSSLRQTSAQIVSEMHDANEVLESSISQSADKIEMNTKSLLRIVGEMTTIPTSISISANNWYSIPPSYDAINNALSWNNTRKKVFSTLANAYGEGYIYLDAGNVYVSEPAGRYIYTGSNYIQPLSGVTRYSVSNVYTSAGISAVYSEDANGKYIKTIDGTSYYDPYLGVTRYEVYPSYYKFSCSSGGVYTAIRYIFSISATQSNISQTAEQLKLSISNEASERKSQISMTDNQIRLDVSDIQEGLNTSIVQNADSIKIAADSMLNYTVAETTVNSDPLDGRYLFLIVPVFNQESQRYEFSDPDYVSKYRYANTNTKSAFQNGYRFFENSNICYIESQNGDYILSNGNYVDPYLGYTRYSRTAYDNDGNDENNGQTYSYFADPDGRYILDGLTYIDPMYDYEHNVSCQRYIKISEYKSYNMLQNITSEIVKFTCVLQDSINAGNVVLSFGGRHYLINSSVNYLYDFIIEYNIDDAKISVMSIAGEYTTLIEQFDSTQYSVIEDGSSELLDETIPKVTNFEVITNDFYTWVTYTNSISIHNANITLSNNEIKQTVNDAAGIQSQIKQTSENITSIISGAPSKIGEIGGIQGSSGYEKALSILNNITNFYSSVPQFNESINEFLFKNDPLIVDIGGYMDAYAKNYRYFSDGTIFYYEQDDEGQYVKEEIYQEPIYSYYNPKDDASHTKWYSKYGDIYIEEADGNYFANADGSYTNPWIDARLGTSSNSHLNHTYDKDGETYTVNDTTGMYVPRLVYQEPIYRYYKPYYQSEDQSILKPRYVYHIMPSPTGTLLYNGSEYINPYDGKIRYAQVLTQLSSEDVSEMISTYGRLEAQEKFYQVIPGGSIDNPDHWIRPYFYTTAKYGSVLRKQTYSVSSVNINGTPNYKADEYGNYIINTDGTYTNPMSETLYAISYVQSLDGNYINELDEYINPFYHKARFSYVYTENENGSYIYDSERDVYYEPFVEATSTNRYNKFPSYCKFFYSSNGLFVKYYGRINDKVNSTIEQTAEGIKMLVCNETTSIRTSLDLTNDSIIAKVEDVEDNLQSKIKQTQDHIDLSVKDLSQGIKSSIKISSDNIESTASGSFYCIASSSDQIINVQRLYNTIPEYQPDLVPGREMHTFIDRGDFREYHDTESPAYSNNILADIEEGFKYKAGSMMAVDPKGYYYCSAITGFTRITGSKYKKVTNLVPPVTIYRKTVVKCVSSDPGALFVIADDDILSDGSIHESDVGHEFLGYYIKYTNEIVSEYPARTYVTFEVDPDGYYFISDVDEYLHYNPMYDYTVDRFEYAQVVSDDNITISDDESHKYMHTTKWYGDNVGYYKYEYSGTQDRLAYEFYVKANTDYESKISQTANKISLEVSEVDGRLQSALSVTEANIMAKVNAKDDSMKAYIDINADSINSVVSGSYIKVSSGNDSSVCTSTPDLYKSVPLYDEASGEFINTGIFLPRNIANISNGFKYAAGIGLAPYATGTYNSSGTDLGTRYKKIITRTDSTYIESTNPDGIGTDITETEPIITISYEEDPTGNYYYNGSDYIYNDSWFSGVNGYYKFINETTYEFYVKANTDYESKISQTANKISLEVSEVDGRLQSALSVTEANIMAKVNAKDDSMKAYIDINADSINSVVSGSYIKNGPPESIVWLPGNEVRLYRTPPVFDGNSYTFSGPSVLVEGTDEAANAIANGYIYCQHSDVLIKSGYKDVCYVHDIQTNTYPLASSALESYAKYKLISTTNSNGNLFNNSSDGAYILSLIHEAISSKTGHLVNADGAPYGDAFVFVIPQYFIKSCSFQKLDSESQSTIFIPALNDYGSKIVQTIDSITASVSDGTVNASLMMYLLNNESNISLTGTKINLNGSVIQNSSGYQIHIADGSIIQYSNYGNSSQTTSWGLSADGSFYAKKGFISGWTISKESIYTSYVLGNVTHYSGILGLTTGQDENSLVTSGGTSPVRFFAGSIDFNPYTTDCTFLVLEDGSLYANAASIRGCIYAESGEIGGWYIGTEVIGNSSTASMSTVGMYHGTTFNGTSLISASTSPVRFFAGGIPSSTASTSISNCKFLVLEDGSLYANAASISGTITAASGIIGPFYIGYSDGTTTYPGSELMYFVDSGGRYTGMQSSNRISMVDTSGNVWYPRIFSGLGSITENSDLNFTVLNDGTVITKQLISPKISGIFTGTVLSSFILASSLSGCSLDDCRISTSQTAIFSQITANKIVSGKNATNWIDMNYSRNQSTVTYHYKVTAMRNQANTNHVYLTLTETSSHELLTAVNITVYRKNVFGQTNQTTYTFSKGTHSNTTIDHNTGDWWNVLRYSLTSSDCSSNFSSSASTFSEMTFDQVSVTEGSSSIDIHGDMTPYNSAISTTIAMDPSTNQPVANQNNISHSYTGFSLGNSAYVWDDIWCDNLYFCGAISYSDKILKKDILDIGDAYDDLYDKLEPSSYKYIFGKSGRTHIGLIGNSMKRALDEVGIPTSNFAPYVEYHPMDKDSKPMENITISSIRYSELIPLNINQIQKLKRRTKSLEDEVASLHDEISQLREQLTNNNN